MTEKLDIARCALFEGIPQEQLAEIASLCRTVRFSKGTTIFREADQADQVFILRSGKVDLTFTLPGKAKGTRVPIRTILPGELFAWSPLVGGEPLSAQADAVEDCEACCIQASELRKLLDAHPEVGYWVMSRLAELIAQRLRDTRAQLRWVMQW